MVEAAAEEIVVAATMQNSQKDCIAEVKNLTETSPINSNKLASKYRQYKGGMGDDGTTT